VQETVLDKVESGKLRVFVVWTPRYLADNRAKAVTATKLVADKRATHFWDGTGWLGKYYGKALELPKKRTFAWDVYFVFDTDATWGDEPPKPSDWMHQLGGADGRQLDADKLRDIVRKRLKVD
jgi:hypothetical protein